ncbi:MAG TPA: hypothetical protein VHG32_27620 [Thermoanaerobaculia bacterium]|jgi:hypothetical protein|nr:hypothetical protein [Thermoanaerobaculia bacterium]
MTFTVRDLMLNVFPAPEANASEPNAPELWLCVIASQGEPKPPPPPPKGPPKPPKKPGVPCPMDSQTLPVAEAAAELASLDVLREQLRQSLQA